MSKSKSNNKSRSSTPGASSKQNQAVSPAPSRNTSRKRNSRKRGGSDDYDEHLNLDPVTEQAYMDALEDVHTRFILNLPKEELETSDRIFFQLEQAWWFYDDLICDEYEEQEDNKITLPRFSNLHPFSQKMFAISPLLNPMMPHFDQMWEEFSKYKRKISTYGTILLNSECTKVVLCQVWQGKSWTFPAGKVNQGEHGIDAGARETYEETGFDPNCTLGLTKEMASSNTSLPWKPLSRENAVTYVEEGTGKRRTCYICHGVPEDFDFGPVARKEVSKIEWHDLNSLPKKSYAVLPFLNQLKRWIRKKSKKAAQNNSNSKKEKRSSSSGKKRNQSNGRSSRAKVRNHQDNLVQSGLATIGDEKGWTEEDMFRRNEELLGRKVEYDGNPHVFADSSKVDPHAFRVVGGAFLNGNGQLAEAPDVSRLQPLFRKDEQTDLNQKDENHNDSLQPFFSDQGVTPWGEVVSEATTSKETGSTKKIKKKKQPKHRSRVPSEESADIENDTKNIASGSNAPGLALLKMLHGKSSNENAVESENDFVLTDAEVTKRSQEKKLQSTIEPANDQTTKKQLQMSARDHERKIMNESKDYIYLRQWVKQLPKARATETFGDFKFDVDTIMKSMSLEIH